MVAKNDSKNNDLPENLDEDDLITSDRGYSRRRRGWLMLLTYFLIALAFAVGIVLFGRWVYHRIHKSETPDTSQNTTEQTSTPPASTTTPPANNSTNTNNSSSSSASTTQTNGTVPNTGPGNIVALFAGTAIVAGGLHFIYSVRRAN